MAALKDRIQAEMVAAMKARDQVRVDTLRSALSGFTYKRSEAGKDLSDADELDVVRRQVKQRNDSIAEYSKAKREDLAQREQRERDILMVYLPAQKSPDEIRQIVKAGIAGIPAEGRNQGAVMKAVMPLLKGNADGNLVRQIVTEELAL
ncbi:MAG: GatB/YqeY domain-containing protein [Candidatus Eremiobacteraeota bacterium]|nr:GatB/YqeY domain-containing protein [Candidatus Eremiobacteraeota bacterium]